MTAYANQDAAIAGLVTGIGEHRDETGMAMESIAFGSPAFGHPGTEMNVYGGHLDQSTQTLDADLVTGNTITTTVNGTAIATVFATSHAATMTAHIAAINANVTLAAAGISALPGSTNRIFIVRGKGVDITVTSAVTGGASQAGITIATSTWAKFLGVARYAALGGRDYGAGNAAYTIGTPVNIRAGGAVYVSTGVVSTLDKEAAYAVLSGTYRNTFTNVSTSNYDIGSYFRSNAASGLALLEVRGIK